MRKLVNDMRLAYTVLILLLTGCNSASIVTTQRQTISPELFEIHEAAINGDPEAQFKLGWHYVNGDQVKKDVVVGLSWYIRSAEGENAKAQHEIGDMYYEGFGVPRNIGRSLSWFWKAAMNGMPEALFKLGTMYYNGEGTTQNYTISALVHSRAAFQGYTESQYELGKMYAEGKGMKQDFVNAHMYLNLAAIHLDKARVLREQIAETYMTTEQVTEAQWRAERWKTELWGVKTKEELKETLKLILQGQDDAGRYPEIEL